MAKTAQRLNAIHNYMKKVKSNITTVFGQFSLLLTARFKAKTHFTRDFSSASSILVSVWHAHLGLLISLRYGC